MSYNETSLYEVWTFLCPIKARRGGIKMVHSIEELYPNVLPLKSQYYIPTRVNHVQLSTDQLSMLTTLGELIMVSRLMSYIC